MVPSRRLPNIAANAALAFALVPALAAAASASFARPAAQATGPADATARGLAAVRSVISGEILAHRHFKERAADRPLEERRALYASFGLAFDGPVPGSPDSESVAVFVHQRLTEADIDALAADGLRLDRAAFVPPVAGQHSHGFHLGRMEYASIDRVRRDPRIVRVTSMEHLVEPLRDLALEFINAAPVHLGEGAGPFQGAGVVVAVGDSGVDLTHPDLPAPLLAFDVTTGEWEPDWSTDVANTVIWHGTHVTGTEVGRGVLSEGKYRGAAPAADLVAYKLGNNVDGSSSFADMTKCVVHAASIGADIYTVSYGGFETFLDGSSAMAQAFDAAFASGTLCFASAGNSAQSGRHYSAAVPPDSASATFDLRLSNNDDKPYDLPVVLRVIWRDEAAHDDLNMTLECLTLAEGESIEETCAGTSPRNTEARAYTLWPIVPPNSITTYTLRLANVAIEGPTPLVSSPPRETHGLRRCVRASRNSRRSDRHHAVALTHPHHARHEIEPAVE